MGHVHLQPLSLQCSLAPLRTSSPGNTCLAVGTGTIPPVQLISSSVNTGKGSTTVHIPPVTACTQDTREARHKARMSLPA